MPLNPELTDQDRRDAMRFRRLVAAALNNEVWFRRLAESAADKPHTLESIREALDYVIRSDNAG